MLIKVIVAHFVHSPSLFHFFLQRVFPKVKQRKEAAATPKLRVQAARSARWNPQVTSFAQPPLRRFTVRLRLPENSFTRPKTHRNVRKHDRRSSARPKPSCAETADRERCCRSEVAATFLEGPDSFTLVDWVELDQVWVELASNPDDDWTQARPGAGSDAACSGCLAHL